MNVARESSPRSAGLTYVLCGLLSPLVILLLYFWDWLVETLRKDDYGYGPVFHLTVMGAVLLFNAVLVLASRRSSTSGERARIWVIGSVITFLSALGFVMLFHLLANWVMSSGRWPFG